MGGRCRCRLQRSAHMPARPLPVLRRWQLVQPVPHGRAGARQLLREPSACAHREGIAVFAGRGPGGEVLRSVHGRRDRGKDWVRHRGAGRRRGSGGSGRPPRNTCGRLQARMNQGLSCRPHAGAHGAARSGDREGRTWWGLVWRYVMGWYMPGALLFVCHLQLLVCCSLGSAAAWMQPRGGSGRVGRWGKTAVLHCWCRHMWALGYSEMAGFAAGHGLIAGCCCGCRWRGEDTCFRLCE